MSTFTLDLPRGRSFTHRSLLAPAILGTVGRLRRAIAAWRSGPADSLPPDVAASLPEPLERRPGGGIAPSPTASDALVAWHLRALGWRQNL